VRELAEEHWGWIAGLLESCTITDRIGLAHYLYTTAFIHGAKHGKDKTLTHQDLVNLWVKEKEV
tara:strand:- start:2483 stop:2674 length:192 start_codon:yes stop_codon:yes gene_type:complete